MMAKKIMSKKQKTMVRLGRLVALMTDTKKLCSQDYDEVCRF